MIPNIDYLQDEVATHNLTIIFMNVPYIAAGISAAKINPLMDTVFKLGYLLSLFVEKI